MRNVGSISKYALFTDFLADIQVDNDNVTGTNGNEYLAGYAGDDTLNGGYGSDTIDGGSGINTAVYSGYKFSYSVSKSGATYSVSNLYEGTDTLTNIAYLKFADGTVAIDDALPKLVIIPPPVVIETPKPVISTKSTSGNDQLTGTTNKDTIFGLDGNDSIFGDNGNDSLDGGNGDDDVSGGSGNDIIAGGRGNDYLSGQRGNDKLDGNEGNDTLSGGLDVDEMTGGLGADIFKLSDVIQSGITSTTRDTITDFKHSEGDKIDLSAIDANAKLAGDQAFKFINTGFSKTDASGQLRFDATSKILYASTDSDSSPEFSIQLSGVKSLVTADFIL